ncbi:MAG: TRM11 family SAM-dependent methyltransferase [Thermogladius sp.]
MSTLYYILSGENEDVSESELKTLLELYDGGHSVFCWPLICVVRHSNESAWAKVAERASNVREVGQVYDFEPLPGWEDVNLLASKLRDLAKGFEWIHVTQLHGYLEDEELKRLEGVLEEKTGLTTRYRRGPSLRLIFSGGVVVVGRTLFRAKRRPFYTKVFDRSFAITPSLARTLINLSAVKEGGVLLDPFAGTGTIILEARSIGVVGIGLDIDWSIINGLARNLRHNKNPSIPVLSDGTRASFANIDAVVTDPPYGRGASTRGVELRELLENFLSRSLESVVKWGRVVFMVPAEAELEVDDIVTRVGGLIKSKHYMYVHSSLARVIYVVVPV